MSLEMNRRNFLGLAGLVGATVATTGMLAGCGTSDENGEAEKVSYDISETVSADIVVVGGGGAGCSAATRSAQLGLSTIIVEMAGVLGGTSIMTEGIFAVGSHWQKELNVDPGADYIFTTAMNYHHWLPDGHLFRSFISETAGNIDWLESVGITFKGTGTMCGNTYNTWHIYETREGEISGALYVEEWAAAVEAQGAQIMLNTKAVDTLIEDGKVVAVICEQNDTYIKIETSAVVMATGGYGDNEELVEEFTGMKPGRSLSMGMGNRTGLGISMARDAGGALAGFPGTCMFYGGNLPSITYGTELYCASAFQPLFWVNQDGRRFVNEWFCARNFSFSGNCQSRQDKVFSIVTQAQMDSFVNEGCIFGCGEYIHDGSKLTGLWDEYNQQVEAGNPGIFTADTLEALAEAIEMDPDALAETIATYNQYCVDGADSEFAKDPQYLLPIEDGPYYAFDLKVGYFTTVGGMRVDENAQVLNEDGDPVIGLYATGCDAGGLYGDSYDVSICEGSQQAWAVHSGKKAAEHIASTLG